MKLATYKDGSRDGQLVVVSRDLSQAHFASHIANRLQAVLDDWNYLSPQLQDIFDALNAGRARHPFAFDPTQCMAPLPRAYQWLHGVAYVQHLELLCRAQGVEVPENCRREPLLYQGASDDFLGPHDALVCASEAFGMDFEGQLVAVTGDLPQGCAADRAIDSVRLLMLANNVRLRHLESQSGVLGGSLLDSPCTAFSPVAVTPDELGTDWSRGRVHLSLQCSWNGRKVGMCDANADMAFHFGQLIAQAAKTRRLRAGSLVGSGPVSNQGSEKKGQSSWPKGYSSIAEKRAMEILQDGKAATDYMKYGDTLQIDMKNAVGQSVFGAIDQEVCPPATTTGG
jgi:fumarylacetoacetate (FAA) hydrolase